MTPEKRNHEFVTFYETLPVSLSERKRNRMGEENTTNLLEFLLREIDFLNQDSKSEYTEILERRFSELMRFARTTSIYRGILVWNYKNLLFFGSSLEHKTSIHDLYYVEKSKDSSAGLFHASSGAAIEGYALLRYERGLEADPQNGWYEIVNGYQWRADRGGYSIYNRMIYWRQRFLKTHGKLPEEV